MRIQLGSLPKEATAAAEPDAGRPIRQPGRWASVILASLAGLILLSIPVTWLIVYSNFIQESDPSYPRGGIPWAGMILVFFLGIVAHEFLHMLLYPDAGRSDSTILFINWRRLEFGVYFEGRIARARWIAMRLLPMLALTVLPVLSYHLLERWMTFALESCLWVVMLTNALGSGGDLVAVLIVLAQVPAAGVLNFHRGRAFWIPGESNLIVEPKKR